MITVKKFDIIREDIPDDDPDTSYLDQEGFEDRKKSYEQGCFNFCGVRAKIRLEIPNGESKILQSIESPGLWGIEDDSGEDYFNEVFEEEKETLIQMLETMGMQVE